MPSFIFAEFEDSLDWSKNPDTSRVEKLYRFRDPLEQTLLSHGCQWIKPEGKRLLAALENDQALQAIYEASERMFAANGSVPAPVKLVAHHGDAHRGRLGWFGPDVDHTHRLLDAAPFGYPILSEAAVRDLPLPLGCHRMSLGTHLLRDLWEPEELSTLLPEGRLQMDFPIPRSLGAYKHNLSPQPTPFLGRREELSDLSKRLANPETRLITLLGPGGFGKTRLALQLAADMVGSYEGVYWIPLAPLASPERILATLASTLGLIFYGNEDPLGRITEALGQKRMLLIFDNFEHLPGGRTFVEGLMEAPAVQVVVTSRESLRLTREIVVPIGGLQVPAQVEDPAFEESSAVQLFLQNLRRSGKEVTLDLEDRKNFLELCGILHGMPLGLEMAASLATELPLTEVTSQVRERIDLLTSAMPHLPDRQKSVRAVFEYSWNLLEGNLSTALARLSILRSVFDARTARQVGKCTAEDLQRLVDRSLLIPLQDGRFQLHEIIRYYAKERLYESPAERHAAQAVHSRHFLAYLRSRFLLFHGREQRRYLEEAAAVYEDILAAFDWAVERGHLDWIARSLDAFGLFFERRARMHEGRQAIERLLNQVRQREGRGRKLDGMPLLHAKLLAWKVFLGVRIGLVKDAAAELAEAQKMVGSNGPRPDRAFMVLIHGQMLEVKGDTNAALDKYRKALVLYREVGDPRGMANARNRWSQAHLVRGLSEEARKGALESLAYYEEQEDPSGAAWSHVLLGQADFHESQFQDARRHFRQALEGYLAVGNRDGVGWALILLGWLAQTQGELGGAEQMFREALAIEEELSNGAALAWIHHCLGMTAWFRCRYDEALSEFGKSLDLYQAIDDPKGVIQALHGLGKTRLLRNETEAAETHFHEAAEWMIIVQDPILAAWHGFYLAVVDHTRGMASAATKRLKKVLRTFESEGNLHGTGWTVHLLGEIAFAEGRIVEADGLFRRVLSIARESAMKPMVLEAWLGWARVLGAQGRRPEALEWVEAVLIQNVSTGVTRKKAEQLREEFARTLTSDEREFARLSAAAADLDLWSRRILETAEKPRTRSKPASRKTAKSPPPKKRRPTRR